MTTKDRFFRIPARTRLGVAAAAAVLLGAAGGAGAVSVTRPKAVMAPAVTTPVARLSQGAGVVTVKGRVAEVYGDRFVVQDASGRTMVDAGPDAASVERGRPIMVQGRFERGQLHAAYLVGPGGRVDAVGPAGPPHPQRGLGRDDGPPPPDPRGHGGPPPGGPGGGPGEPPPPPGCAPVGRVAAPPIPAAGAATAR